MPLAHHINQKLSLSLLPWSSWPKKRVRIMLALLIFLCFLFQLIYLQFSIHIFERNLDFFTESRYATKTQHNISTDESITNKLVPLSPPTDSKKKLIDVISEPPIDKIFHEEIVRASSLQLDEHSSISFNSENGESREAEFKWSFLDYDSSDCGDIKCFFPSKIQRNRTGYLVARDLDDDAWRAFNISQSIDRILMNTDTHNTLPRQTRYHYYSAIPPWTFKNIGTTLAKKLGKGRLNDKDFYVGHDLTVQQVDVAPRSELSVLRCKGEARNRLIIENNFFNNDQSSNASATDVKKTAIEACDTVERIHQSIQQTVTVLQAHPDLMFDFQVLINRQGEIYHFDLDRHYGPKVSKKRKMKKINSCKRQLDAFVHELETYLLKFWGS